MQTLHIASTTSSPEIVADWESGTLSMRGDSYPENAFDLYEPLLRWVQSYLRERGQALRVDLHLLYLNTSSIKVMMDLFDLLEEAWQRSQPVSVAWYYDARNERVGELAAEFREDCSFPFDILAERPGS